jgi:uncharacterized membrane protein
MLDHLKVYAAAFAGFLAIDVVWISLTASRFYKKHLGDLLADQPNLGAALVFYVLFIAGLQVFAIQPGLQAGSLARAAALGGFLGMLCYATYDLTNYATLKGWPLIVVVVDIAWGTFLAAAVSCVGYGVGRWLGIS